MTATALPRSPAVARNREPILEVLRRVLPASGTVLEVASGTGEHAVFFAEHMPHLQFQPSDASAEARSQIDAWRRAHGRANVLAPLALDATSPEWPALDVDAIFNANMIHIAPWEACLGLLRHAGRTLRAGAPLVMYGPYIRREVATAPSNMAFDASLRARDSAWGLRALDDVATAAAREGLTLEEVVEMPANNLTVIYRRE